MPEDLREAVKALGIDVPVLCAEDDEQGTTLHLYGGRVVHWRREGRGAGLPAPARGLELTTVWGIGAKTAAALRRRGIEDVAQLLAAHERGELAPYLKPATLARIVQWFEARGYL